MLLTVWDWEDGFDLATCPSPDLRAGVVAIPMTTKATIAFRMRRAAGNWSKGETLVFEECDFKDLRTGDACLVQYGDDKASLTTLANADLSKAAVRLRSIGGRNTLISAESVQMVLRATTRITSL